MKAFFKLGAVFLFFAATVLLLTSHWISKNFDVKNIEQIVFHMSVSLDGVDPRYLVSYGIRIACACLAGIAYAAVIFIKRPQKIYRLLLLLSGPYVLWALFYVGSLYDVYKYLTSARTMSPFIEKEYATLRPEQLQVTQKHNLIFILLESAEETFNNRNLFEKPVMPELAELRQAHTSFYGYNAVPGTSWSIAGLCSYLLGIPLKLPSFMDGNSYDGRRYTSFLPGAASVLEILEAHGYKIDIFAGSDIAFAGEGNLFKTHSSTIDVHDLLFFQAARNDTISSKNAWGVNDFYLYERSKEFLAENCSDGSFFVIVQTTDTHPPEGFVAEDFPREYRDMRDAFRAAGIMTADFVAWAQRQPFYENTTIVIIGDHFYMASDLGGVGLPYEQRDIYNVFINPVPMKGKHSSNRSFSPMDIAPTILESIGFVLPQGRFALGTSLFAPQKTLIESIGINAFTQELNKNSSFYQSFFLDRTPE